MFSKIKSTRTYHPFKDIEVLLFGKPDDWNISHHKLGSVVLNRMVTLGESVGVKDIYSPRPSTFNAKICEPKDLRELQEVSNKKGVIDIWRGCDADGIPLEKGQAFWLSAADCPTVIFKDIKSGKVIAAHAGRNSLIDCARIDSRKKSRVYESVIDAVMAKFKKARTKDVRVFIVNGIGPHNFLHPSDHSEHGESNRKMIEDVVHRYGRNCVVGSLKDGKLSLLRIIKAQLYKYGIKPSQIKSATMDTHNDRDSKGNYVWWSNRRGDKLKRNGVIVVRK